MHLEVSRDHLLGKAPNILQRTACVQPLSSYQTKGDVLKASNIPLKQITGAVGCAEKLSEDARPTKRRTFRPYAKKYKMHTTRTRAG